MSAVTDLTKACLFAFFYIRVFHVIFTEEDSNEILGYTETMFL